MKKRAPLLAEGPAAVRENSDYMDELLEYNRELGEYGVPSIYPPRGPLTPEEEDHRDFLLKWRASLIDSARGGNLSWDDWLNLRLIDRELAKTYGIPPIPVSTYP